MKQHKYWHQCIRTIACMICMTMSATIHGQISSDVRNVQIRERENETTFWLDMASDEQVLVTYVDGNGLAAYPFRGIVFPANSKDLRLRLEVAAPEASRDGQWRIMWGVQDDEHYTAAGGPIRPRPENELRVPVRHLQVPLDLEGLEVHLFPFLMTEHHTGAMLVAISGDRQLIREHIPVMEREGFDWNESFETAESFLPLRKDLAKSKASDGEMD